MANVERDRTLRTLRAKVVARRRLYELRPEAAAALRTQSGVLFGIDEALSVIDEELGIPVPERGRA